MVLRRISSVLVAMLLVGAMFGGQRAGAQKGTTRTYYIAADEVEWDYTPAGRDEAMGMEFDAVAKSIVEARPHRIGHIYKKALYREYTDATFLKVKVRSADEA